MTSLIQGQFVAIVGPSGAGKDSLLIAARDALQHDDRFVFARRIVTREANIAEEHDTLSVPAFMARRAANGFLIDWAAHGLLYGLPRALSDNLAQGQHVIANISRSSIRDAESLCARVTVIHITASPETRARRIAARGRESEDAIRERIARELPLHAEHAHIIEIRNDGSFDDARDCFIATLRDL